MEKHILICPECDEFAIEVLLPSDLTPTLVVTEYNDGTADYHRTDGYEGQEHRVTITRKV